MKKLFLIGMMIVIGGTWLRMNSRYASNFQFLDKDEAEENGEQESGADKQLSSWWWSRSYPDPSDFNDKYYSAWMQARAMKNPEVFSGANGTNGTNDVTLFGGNWVPIGPDQNIGGRMLCVAVDPLDNNTLFAGSASGGIWRSTTGGTGTTGWRAIPTGFPVLGVSSIIIHPTNPKIIYAATGEVYRTANSNIGFNVWKARGTYGVGILKSVDQGNTWSRVFSKNMSDLFAVQTLKFHPSDPNIIYACTTDGLYRSSDAGSNWTRILNKIYVADIAINPSNPNMMVVSVGNLQDADKGIYRTSDGGTTWTKITAGLPATFEGFIRFDNVSANANMIIASIGRDAGSNNELYQSNDFGLNWSVLSSSNHCQYQFWFSHDVAIDPGNTDHVIMGGVSLYNYTLSSSARSTMSGVHSDIHSVIFDPVNKKIVYVTTDGGIYKSTDGGNSYSMINGGLQAVQFYASFAVSPTNANIMIGGLQDNGVVRYNGSYWTSVAGGDGGPSVFHPTNSNIVFSSNDARRVLRSTNGGNSFSEVLSSWAFTADSRTAFMAPIAISKSNPSVVYSASDNLHKSTTGGVAGSFPGNASASAINYIEAQHKTAVALAVSPVNENKVYISTSSFAQYDNDVNNLYVNTPPNLFKSLNGGASFINIKSNLPDRFVMDFAISPNNDDSVWVVLGGFGSSHVYVSADGGATWVNKGVGLPDVPHNAIVLDPINPSVLYVGNDLGIYMSPDNGVSWYDYNRGLWDATQIMDLVITPGNKMVAATHGKGAFLGDLFTTVLPVDVMNFTGSNNGRFNNLKWTTVTEAGLDHFELERSYGGGPYSRIADVAVNNSPVGSNYTYNDDISGVKNIDAIFYRLKIIEKNQHSSYSNVVSIRIPVKSTFVILGNPINDRIRIQATCARIEEVKARLFDAAGRKIVEKIFPLPVGINEIEMSNLRDLPSGAYVLELTTNRERFTQKIIRK